MLSQKHEFLHFICFWLQRFGCMLMSKLFRTDLIFITGILLADLGKLNYPERLTPGDRENPTKNNSFSSSTGYLVIVGCISFAVCYKYGPLENERNINLLTWGLQTFGLLLLYMSIQIRYIGVILIVIAICTKNLEYPVIWAYAIYR